MRADGWSNERAGAMMELMFTLKGCTPAVEERARRLLKFELGFEDTGRTVTVATLFADCQISPEETAQHLMRIPPRDAVDHLSDWIDTFQIDGEPCPEPKALARAALLHAGRAV
jgi:hypothetical protein